MNQKILALVLVLALAISAMTLTAFAHGPQNTCQETCTVCSHRFENGVCTDCGTVCSHTDRQTTEGHQCTQCGAQKPCGDGNGDCKCDVCGETCSQAMKDNACGSCEPQARSECRNSGNCGNRSAGVHHGSGRRGGNCIR